MGIPIQKLQKTSSFIIRSSPSFLYLYINPLVFGLNHNSRNVGVIHECFTFIYSCNPLHECAPESFSYQGCLHICNATPSTVHDFFRPSQMVRSISLRWKSESKRKTAKGIQNRHDELQFLTSYTNSHTPPSSTHHNTIFIIAQIPAPHLLKSRYLSVLHW